jgi:hypothetical protein
VANRQCQTRGLVAHIRAEIEVNRFHDAGASSWLVDAP